MWEEKSHSLIVGMQSGTASAEGSLLNVYKTRHTLPIRPNNCYPWYLPKWAENLHPHVNACSWQIHL